MPHKRIDSYPSSLSTRFFEANAACSFTAEVSARDLPLQKTRCYLTLPSFHMAELRAAPLLQESLVIRFDGGAEASRLWAKVLQSQIVSVYGHQ
jgi:hypothetical protein